MFELLSNHKSQNPYHKIDGEDKKIIPKLGDGVFFNILGGGLYGEFDVSCL
jgi:hypothetical protein